jgi:class 3 adenylate cyclase/energy-coupling factor transporter ATP-binding protein EcfA2
MLTCARCGQENPDGAKFCNACGAGLVTPGRAGEERRVVSVLFVDLAGFTGRAESLDPEDVRAFLVPYYERVRTELESHGGRVEKFVGDAVMGVFGAPVAYGDDAERAVRAAFAVRDWAEQEGLELRLAVNTGEAIVELEARPEHGEALVAGDVVNTAARLQSAAPVGGVLVGEETHASTRGAIEYRPAQPIAAKGKELPVSAWLAVHPLTGAGERHVTPVPMIGRERELAVLTGIWDRVVDEGRAHFVTVLGPSGIGKSRIALELAQLVADQGARVIRGRSTPYGASSPYSAFAQQVKQIAQIFDSDTEAEAQAKLSAAIASIAGPTAAEEHGPDLAVLLGLGTEGDVGDREQLFFSARVLVESLALRGPTLLLYDDIHWADTSLLDLLETFAARVREVPVMFVALARPELLTQRAGWGGGLPAYTALQLEPLSESSSADLAEQLLASDPSTAARAAAIARTAEGNPLFIEELSASLAERSTADAGELPTSVRAIIAARLDSLPPAERAVLVDASVAGRVFWRGALTEMAEREDLSALLGSLEGRDLVQREAVSRIKGDQQFAFKHGLIHDVAYQSLPRAARRERHAAVARFLEATVSSGQSHEALGQHWREAGEPDRAVEHFTAAADQAGRGWAKERAVVLYRETLELLSESDPRRRDVTRSLAVALQAAFHVSDARRLRGGEPADSPSSAESRQA